MDKTLYTKAQAFLKEHVETALLKEFNDTTKHSAGKMQSEFLLNKQGFKESYDNQELLE